MLVNTYGAKTKSSYCHKLFILLVKINTQIKKNDMKTNLK